ncbi:MAG TPA: LssY C-terminal domain-containing protein, partial [Gemmatales bacterium]|nr:LssY C-terminal domain-containing protein [Gemmatales bacterium]
MHSPEQTPPRGRWRRTFTLVVGFLLVWAVAAYLIVPRLWEHYGRRHAAFESIPGITYTGSGIPGDPLNVALIGSKQEVMKLMVAAKYYPADPLTLESCLEIAEATVLRRPYDHAPVSNLFLWGRKEDLAFEQPIGADPRQRHHVRFWLSDQRDSDGRPVWVGATTRDKGVGLSHTTGQITHHIAPDVDTERDFLVDVLGQTGRFSEVYYVN